MPDGIQFARVVYAFAVEHRVYIWRDEWQGEWAKKRWLNVLVCQQVSHLFHSSVSASDDVLFDIENFETKDMRWAPDGKGFIWLLCQLYIIYYYFESTTE